VWKLVFPLLLSCAAMAAAQPAAKPWDAWQPPVYTAPVPNAFDLYLKAFALKKEIDASLPHPPPPVGAPPAPPAAPGGPPPAAPAAPPPAGGAPPPPPPPPGAPVAPIDRWGEGNPDMPLPARVAMYDGVIKLVREALPLECGIEPPGAPDTPLPYLASFRGLARLLAMEAEVRRESGHFGAAAESALDCLRMAQQVKSQRILIAYLVGAACEAIALASLDETLPGLKADEAKAALTRLQKIVAGRPSLQPTLEGEEVWAKLCFKRLAADPATMQDSMRALTDENVTPEQAARVVAALPETWAKMGATYQQMRQTAEMPYRQRRPGRLKTDDWLLDLLLPAIDKVLFRATVSDTRMSLHVLALAAQAYRAERGNFPPQLMELVPGTLPAIPPDPFTGGPLAAVVAPDKLVLYSFGPDGVDNGGVPVEKAFTADSKGDVVLELNLSPKP
jgi:hypothetical protein